MKENLGLMRNYLATLKLSMLNLKKMRNYEKHQSIIISAELTMNKSFKVKK